MDDADSEVDPATVEVMPAGVFQISHLIGYRKAEDLAADLAVSTRTVQRWLESGVNWEQADVFATKILRDYPSNVWGTAWEEAVDERVDHLASSRRSARRFGLEPEIVLDSNQLSLFE